MFEDPKNDELTVEQKRDYVTARVNLIEAFGFWLGENYEVMPAEVVTELNAEVKVKMVEMAESEIGRTLALWTVGEKGWALNQLVADVKQSLATEGVMYW